MTDISRRANSRAAGTPSPPFFLPPNEGGYRNPPKQDLGGDKFSEDANLLGNYLIYRWRLNVYYSNFQSSRNQPMTRDFRHVIEISAASAARAHQSWHEDSKRLQFENQRSPYQAL